MRILALSDQFELLVQRGPQLGGHALGKSLRGPLPDQFLQPVLRLPPFGHRLVGILVGDMIQPKLDPVEDGEALRYRPWPVGE